MGRDTKFWKSRSREFKPVIVDGKRFLKRRSSTTKMSEVFSWSEMKMSTFNTKRFDCWHGNYTLWWHDYNHGTYNVMTWLPSWYLHCDDLTTIIVTTPWWHDNHHGTYTVVTLLPSWYLHGSDLTAGMGYTLTWKINMFFFLPGWDTGQLQGDGGLNILE